MLLTNYQTALKKEKLEERRLHFFEKGQNISLTDSGIWQVYRGVVQLSQIQLNGEEILLGWGLPEQFFGSYFTKVPDYQAKALSDIYLKWYLVEEIDQNQELAQRVLEQLISKSKQTEALLAIAGLKRVEEKLQKLLQLLRQEISEPTPQGDRLVVRFTHQNIASSIGTTRVTITRLLGEFQRQGWISFDSERHIIIAREALHNC